jgi:hypothetical protein
MMDPSRLCGEIVRRASEQAGRISVPTDWRQYPVFTLLGETELAPRATLAAIAVAFMSRHGIRDDFADGADGAVAQIPRSMKHKHVTNALLGLRSTLCSDIFEGLQRKDRTAELEFAMYCR